MYLKTNRLSIRVNFINQMDGNESSVDRFWRTGKNMVEEQK